MEEGMLLLRISHLGGKVYAESCAAPSRNLSIDSDSKTVGVNAFPLMGPGPQFYFQTGHERLVMTSAVIRQPNAQWWKGK